LLFLKPHKSSIIAFPEATQDNTVNYNITPHNTLLKSRFHTLGLSLAPMYQHVLFNVNMTTRKKSIIFYTIHFTRHKQPFLFVSPSLSNYKFHLLPLHHLQNIIPSFQNFCFYLQTDHLCITNIENFYNFDLTVVFANGRIIENEEDVHFKCPSPKFIRIPYNCSFSHLKEKVCGALGLQD